MKQARALAMTVNDRQAFACALAAVGDLLPCPVDSALPNVRFDVGLAFLQNDEVLLRKRPLPRVPAWSSFLGEPRTERLLAVVVPSRPGAFDAATCQPFRYHRWFGVFAGGLEDDTRAQQAVRSFMPEHLARNIRTQSYAETLLSGYLSVLDQEPEEGPFATTRAVAAAFEGFANLLERTGGQPAPGLGLFVSERNVLGAIGLGRPLWALSLDGLGPCPRCSDSAASPGLDRRIVAHPHVKARILSTHRGPAGAWREIPAGEPVLIDDAFRLVLRGKPAGDDEPTVGAD